MTKLGDWHYMPNNAENPVFDVYKWISNIRKQRELHFENVLRNNCIPPIKGEITKGKMKWRGLSLCAQHGHLENREWIEQRGVKIGEDFIFTVTLKL